jgi:hypothetical protein
VPRNRLSEWYSALTGASGGGEGAAAPAAAPGASRSGGGAVEGASGGEDWEFVSASEARSASQQGPQQAQQAQQQGALFLRVSQSLEDLSFSLMDSASSIFMPRSQRAPPAAAQLERELVAGGPASATSRRPSQLRVPQPPPGRYPGPTPRQRFNARMEAWDEELDKYPWLHSLEQRTGVRKNKLALLFVALAVAVLVFGMGMGVITAVVGFAFPVYGSFKVIEQPEPESVRRWLRYWVVYALFCVAEAVLDRLLFWVPVYNGVKIAFLVWCFSPRFDGAAVVYDAAVRPLLAPLHERFVEASDTVQRAAAVTVHRMGAQIKASAQTLASRPAQS